VTFAHDGAGIGAVAGLSPEAAARLVTAPGVRAVVADAATTLEPVAGDLATAQAPSLAGTAGDPALAWGFPRQWHLRAIGAERAWAAGRHGSPAVRVAILDTGLDYRHPDLAGRVDLAGSRSFVPSEAALLEANFPGAHPVADLHYHGTHVGATVASNGIIAAGVTSRVTLVGLKVCTLNGRCPVSNVLAGLVYSADLGVDVANVSIGNAFERADSSAAHRDGPSFVAVVNQALAYVHRKGTTVVVAAGNQNRDLDHDGNQYRVYCSAPSVICVSATGPASAAGVDGPFVDVDARAWYSNYGRSVVTVAAPGGAAQPTWAACSTFSLVIPGCRAGAFVLGLLGTSAASPHAAGVAALIAEDVGRDPSQVRARLQATADDRGEPGTDPFYGKGRINAARAVGLP
ncbi:MAG TPA: S8 family serine peptidase, partial [Longimicrobium sp.]|nr:S8 family serine peptidase [Longimicrobium sp.]